YKRHRPQPKARWKVLPKAALREHASERNCTFLQEKAPNAMPPPFTPRQQHDRAETEGGGERNIPFAASLKLQPTVHKALPVRETIRPYPSAGTSQLFGDVPHEGPHPLHLRLFLQLAQGFHHAR